KRHMAEYYVLTGALPAALAQLQQARSASQDFYEKSVLDARITDVQRRVAEDKALMDQFRGLEVGLCQGWTADGPGSARPWAGSLPDTGSEAGGPVYDRFPFGHAGVGLFGSQSGRKDAFGLPERLKLIQTVIYPVGQAGQKDRAQRRGLDDPGPHDLYAQQI